MQKLMVTTLGASFLAGASGVESRANNRRVEIVVKPKS